MLKDNLMGKSKVAYLYYLLKRQKIAKTIWKAIFYFCCYILVWPISQFTFRKKNLWLLGGGHTGFNGNAKFLYYYLADNSSIDVFWIADSNKENVKLRDFGVKSYYRWSVMGILKSMTAAVYFTNNYTSDINYFTSGRAIYFNLWHGVGLKSIEFSIKDGLASKAYNTRNLVSRFFMPYHFKRPDYFLSTSRRMSTHFAESFRISENQCLELKGYPRNELLLREKSQVKDWILEHERQSITFVDKIEQYSKSYIYMPTWRDKERDFIQDTGIDFKSLNDLMMRKNALFIFKLHPSTKVDLSVLQLYSNLIEFNSTLDVYTILPFIDVLVTDYSSIYHDFMLSDGKEVVLYPYDLEKSEHNEAGITLQQEMDYEQMMPGVRAYNFSDLCKLIESDERFVFTNVDFIKSVFWGDVDENASSEIVRFVSNQLKKDL